MAAIRSERRQGNWLITATLADHDRPQNTRVHLQGAPQRLASDENQWPHLRALSGATRCSTAGSFGRPHAPEVWRGQGRRRADKAVEEVKKFQNAFHLGARHVLFVQTLHK
jgi:hypothetical protein